MTVFVGWLLTQSGRSDTVGQLARTAARDPHLPRRSWRLRAFLRWAGTDAALREQVKVAHAEWRRLPKDVQ